MSGLVLLILASLPVGDLPRCDMVEVNHYCPEGGSGFVQVIAWDWDPCYRRWHAQQWVIVSDWSRVGDVTCVRTEIKSISVRSRLFRETWTRDDPERANGKLFPVEHRRRVW